MMTTTTITTTTRKKGLEKREKLNQRERGWPE